MPEDDPFGLHHGVDHTVVIRRPQPGGRPIGGPPPGAFAMPPSQADIAHPSANPLLAAGSRLLSLAARLRRPEPPASPQHLRESVLGELKSFAARAGAAGASREHVQAASWALCALLDDTVLNTPWGRQSDWPTQSLCGTLYQEVDAGERFFDRLQQLEREPTANRELLEFWHACLAMGFEGRYRVAAAGRGGLGQVRDELYRIIRSVSPAGSRELASDWRGAAVPLEPPAQLPLWVLGSATLLGLLAIWAAFAFHLGGYAEAFAAQVRDMPPAAQPEIVRAVMSEPPPPPNIPLALLPKYRGLLQAEIEEGRVVVDETATTLIIRLRNQGLFASGSAEPSPSFAPLLDRLGRALDEEEGSLRVVGHTDDIPIRKSPRFRSNWELSEARAEGVADRLQPWIRDAARIRVEGRADTEPLQPNRDEASRAANRRVEILLAKGG
jgi:type VI secretion system protein ImpK